MIESKLSRKEDERIWLISAILILPLLVGGAVYLVDLKSIGVIESETNLVFYAFLLTIVSVTLSFGFREILYSRKVKDRVTFYLKRFLAHSFFSTVYFASMIALWFVLRYVLVLVSWKYTLLISLLVSTFTLAAVMSVARVKRFLIKIETGK